MDTTEIEAEAEDTTEDNQENYGQDDSTTEDEGEATTEGVKQHTTESPESKRTRLERQLSQHNKKHGFSNKEGSKETKEVGSDDRVNRIELKSEGIKDKKAQDVVLEYIAEKKVLGKEVDIETALRSVAVKEALQEIKAKNVPPPSTRTTGGASDSLAYWVQETKKGNFPTDPAIRKQLREMRIF